MTHHLYALLVGINQYDERSRVASLRGCINDVKAMQSYLESRVDRTKTETHIRTLLDEQATRQAIIDGFREHLQQANEGDTVLFYYAGHGSQNTAPPEFWTVEPDRRNETLLCYDSRTENSRDLADKELSKLIHEVSRSNPHIVVVLDCCHSGSGTRGEIEPAVGKRRAPVDLRDRPIESFIVSLKEVEQQARAQTAQASSRSPSSTAGWHLPQGRHVLIAACLDNEEASEHFDNGQSCGAFSHFLIDTLQKTNGSLTYRDLYSGVYARMRSQISAQSPQIEATYLEDINQPFLGGAIAPFAPYFTLSYCDRHGWSINGGAVHGIPQPADSEATKLAIFPFGSSPEDMQQLDNALAKASVTDVLPQLSRIHTDADADLDTDAIYKAVVTDLPLPLLGVTLEGDADEIAVIREALQVGSAQSSSALRIREVADVSLAKFRVLACAGDYLVTRPADNRPLIAPTSVRAPNADRLLLQQLSHIARWTTVAELTHPAASQLPANTVEIQLYYNNQQVDTGQVQLNYEQHNGQWQKPHFKAKLVNTTHRRLYCTLLNLTEQYSVSAPFFSSGGIWLEANSEAWAIAVIGGKSTDLIPTSVPQTLWEQGITEYKDILKLVASTAEFDPTLLLQSKLDAPPLSASRSAITPPRSTLARLMQRVDTRDIGEVETVEAVDDWMTSQIMITTVRPQVTETISVSQDTPLGRQVVIRPHSHLKAKARLTKELTATQSTRVVRSRNTPSLPPLLRDCTQPLQFTASRGTDSGLEALELSEISCAEAVTAEQPLKLLVNTPLAPGESVLPIAYDGEFFVPLGYGHAQGSRTEIVLQRLPQPSPEDSSNAAQTRSIGGTISILFRKVATHNLGETLSQKLGFAFEYPILAAVDASLTTDKNETLSLETDIGEIRERVAHSEKIVLYVHGITGDTLSMVPSIQTARVELEGQSRTLSEVYDLVLTCDYESLNTSIAMTAMQIKQRLAAIGLEPGHDKTLHIVAHSMGGLVSRWLIEKEGGDGLVQHLIMLGTPNAGSPWPVVQAGLTKALSFAINGLSTVVWPLRLVGSVLNTLEAIDVALDEMEPGSELLALLAASEPPIPYSIVAGNTDLIPPDEKAALRARLERKLSNLLKLPFLKEANDIAVSVESIRRVPAAARYVPQVREVACDHTVYFTDPAGLDGLSWAIALAFTDGKSPPTENRVSLPIG
ncbi:MAG: caspase family protein [Phormidesmis sp.]